MKKNKLLYKLMSIVVGTFLISISVEMFILPYSILSGGVAGIAVALKPFTHIDETIMSNTLVIVLLFVGRIFLGKEFFLDTALSSILYPIFNVLLAKVITVPEISQTLAALYGGILGGIGVGMVMRVGGSTGGMDVPKLIIHKFTGIKVSTLSLALDSFSVLLGLSGYGLGAVLIGLVSAVAASMALEKVLSMNGSASKSVQIISDHWQEILSQIDLMLGRGATVFNAQGGYNGQERKVILCAVSSKQYPKLVEMLNDVDPNAFVITCDASDMHGEGFSYGIRI